MSETAIFTRIIDRARAGVAIRQQALPLDLIQGVAKEASPPRPFGGALTRGGGVSVIAEYKRRSPSRGVIREDLAPQDVAVRYEAAGAVALSVLTDEEFFGGQLDHLTAARGATRLPALRKDFVVDPYQIWEARAASADAVLLIATALGDADLRSLLAEARAASLEALVEVHDEAELERAIKAGAAIIGVNSRDLRTMEVSLETSVALAPRIPASVVKVAESGIKTGADIKRLRDAGFDAFLVGTQLMQAADPGAALQSLIAEAQG